MLSAATASVTDDAPPQDFVPTSRDRGELLARKRWDVFLSHAGEDKATFVRPLAQRLSEFGLAVAFDEFSFRLGDSLIASIDYGIAESDAGVLVLSEAFFVKPWTSHEKNGLMQRLVMEPDYVLIPVWFGVGHREVAQFSPTLADRLAVDAAGLSPDTVALRLLERVRPDVFNATARRLEFELARRTGRVVYEPLSELKPGPIRHATLPTSYVDRLRVVASVFASVASVPSLPKWLENFQRDIYPDLELRVWERMAACYLEACRELAADDPQRRLVYLYLLSMSLSDEANGADSLRRVEPPVQQRLFDALSFRAPWE